jgi:septal ring factor EnvC (AmiA/AmiB activator)
VTPEISEFERGRKEGRVDALLEEHTARLNKINGSVERHAKSNETLAKEMRAGFDKVATVIASMQEDARARELAVTVAAETLATETERRRADEERLRQERADALEVPSRAWDIRANKASVVGGAVTLALGISTIYLAFH